jgi:hypothetical protein
MLVSEEFILKTRQFLPDNSGSADISGSQLHVKAPLCAKLMILRSGCKEQFANSTSKFDTREALLIDANSDIAACREHSAEFG